MKDDSFRPSADSNLEPGMSQDDILADRRAIDYVVDKPFVIWLNTLAT